MKEFHGYEKKRGFFEGWYFKHQGSDGFLAVIPAYHIDKKGNRAASLQIITENQAFMVPFAAEEFSARTDRLSVALGRSFFSRHGIRLNLKTEEVSLSGQITYQKLTPPKTDIMGPLKRVPFLQCRHGIVSLAHGMEGSICLNGKHMDFSQGMGYIEKDWGRSFPSDYLWTHAGWTDPDSRLPSCVMLALADIPFAGRHFTGCICSVLFDGKEYRLATYKGVKILEYTDQEVLIRQGNLVLHANLLEASPLPLSAPAFGSMSRVIRESPACKVRFQFFSGKKKIFDIINSQAGFETG